MPLWGDSNDYKQKKVYFTDNLLYTVDAQYDTIRYNDNLSVTKPSLKR